MMSQEKQEKQEKKTFLPGFEENLMGVAMIIALVLMLSTCFTQFFMSEESVAVVQQMSFYAYAWVVSFALSICARDNIYHRVPLLEKHLPEAGQKALLVFQNVVSVVMLAALLVLYIRATINNLAAGTPDKVAPFIPLALCYVALTIGFSLANVRNIVRVFKGGT